MKYSLWFALIFCLFQSSCKREVIPADEVDLGKEYFPLTNGHFIEYEVDSLKYNDFSQDTELVHCQFHDEISEQFLDNEGRNSYFIKRYIRYNDTAQWLEHTTYYATQTNFRLEVVEDNLRFIKLVFPVKANTVWNGNVYLPASSVSIIDINWYLNWDYKYKNINADFDNGIVNFPNSVCVEASIGPNGTGLVNDSLGIADYSEYTAYKECYARNIGMVYRQLTHWVYQKSEGFRSGFSVVFRAKNYN